MKKLNALALAALVAVVFGMPSMMLANSSKDTNMNNCDQSPRAQVIHSTSKDIQPDSRDRMEIPMLKGVYENVGG